MQGCRGKSKSFNVCRELMYLCSNYRKAWFPIEHNSVWLQVSQDYMKRNIVSNKNKKPMELPKFIKIHQTLNVGKLQLKHELGKSPYFSCSS